MHFFWIVCSTTVKIQSNKASKKSHFSKLEHQYSLLVVSSKKCKARLIISVLSSKYEMRICLGLVVNNLSVIYFQSSNAAGFSNAHRKSSYHKETQFSSWMKKYIIRCYSSASSIVLRSLSKRVGDTFLGVCILGLTSPMVCNAPPLFLGSQRPLQFRASDDDWKILRH